MGENFFISLFLGSSQAPSEQKGMSSSQCWTEGTHCWTTGIHCWTVGTHFWTAGTHCWTVVGTHCWTAGTHCWTAGTHCWTTEGRRLEQRGPDISPKTVKFSNIHPFLNIISSNYIYQCVSRVQKHNFTH